MNDLPPAIYDESLVPEYVLPALQASDVTRALFTDYVYGRAPEEVPKSTVELIEENTAALDGLAWRREFRVTLSHGNAHAQFGILLYTPAAISQAVPVFLGLNYFGNHTVHSDPAIILPVSWCRDDASKGVVEHRATEAGRGTQASRWPIETILERGCGVATVYYGDFAPDDPAHVREGLLAFYNELPAETRGAAISAWAWGLSRALDAIITLPEIDPERVAVVGHSRHGKTALWAGACDERFALVISNEAGCGGSSLARRRYGERILHLNTNFPHWFAKNYRGFNEREEGLPVDQHQLIALIAPRAVYIASAEGDQWADPRGEYLALAAAAPAWGESLPPESPEIGQSFHAGKLGYHIRAGKHDITCEDWKHFLNFAGHLWNP